MSVYELNKDQMVELKERHLTNHIYETEDRDVSMSELVQADEIVSDDDIYDNYGGIDFSEDDFFCSMEA